MQRMTIPPANISASPVKEKYLPVCELLGNHRTAEIVTLSVVTISELKESKLFSGFHTLRYNSLLEASSHVDHRANDGGIVALGSDSLHE
jgi:hypothetical protein